jgi:hypothetical protein
MSEYRAFDGSGVVIAAEEINDTDSAVAWGMSITAQGARLVERKAGDDWVCFQEYYRSHQVSEDSDGS